jgi:hypothetical protein
VPHRKMIRVDVLRDVLGEAQTDELLTRLNPPPPTVRVDLNELNLAHVLYADPMTESKKWEDTLPVVRRYFLERSQARRHFLEWVAAFQANPEALENGAQPQSRPRRRITDPAALERRRAALAKARAVRAEKIRARREGA